MGVGLYDLALLTYQGVGCLFSKNICYITLEYPPRNYTVSLFKNQGELYLRTMLKIRLILSVSIKIYCSTMPESTSTYTLKHANEESEQAAKYFTAKRSPDHLQTIPSDWPRKQLARDMTRLHIKIYTYWVAYSWHIWTDLRCSCQATYRCVQLPIKWNSLVSHLNVNSQVLVINETFSGYRLYGDRHGTA